MEVFDGRRRRKRQTKNDKSVNKKALKIRMFLNGVTAGITRSKSEGVVVEHEGEG